MIADLFRAMEWSDALMWKAAGHTPEALDDTRLRETIYHLHEVQHAFLSVWRGMPARPPSLAQFPNMAAFQVWMRGYYEQANAFIASLDEEAMNRPVILPWADKNAAVPTLRETLLQVVMHSTHHRGQVSFRLRDLGGQPPLVDFIQWLWLGKPAADWS